ncbi:MAG TPA: hypothetical protein VGO56_06010 [Pyrinomonadaceae bacterium]|jgi:hypothetical protein|nr:hypothetical protein [Pyrinomonadaceae bacterium]
MKMINSPLKQFLAGLGRVAMRVLSGVKSHASARALLFVAFCAVILFAVFSETDIMRAQQPGSRALVRHGFTINGRIEGSVQQLTGENTTLNGGGVLTGDLLVPGVPTVHLNGSPTFGGTVPGSGSAQPTNYQVTINGGAQLGHLVTRTDPGTMPNVAAPPASTGTRDVTLNNSSQSPGNFATLRDLTLNGNVGMITVPAGTYRKFTANGGSGFVLGVAGATQPAIYNFNSLLLNGGSQLQVVGPVLVTSATAVTLNAAMGAAGNPLWLSLNVAAGGLTLNGGSALYGVVTAPSGLVTINGNSSLIGNVICDRLTSNGGLLRILQQGDTTAPVVTIQQPVEGALTNATQVTVSGTFSDASQTTITVNGISAALNGNSFSVSVPLTEGANSLLLVATDAAGNHADVTRHVVRDTTAPTVAIAQPLPNTITNGSQIIVSGSFNGATSVQINNVNATLAGNTFSATVPLSEGGNVLTVVATDAAGNHSEATRGVIRDSTSPTLTVTQPAPAATIASLQTNVTGTFADATVTTIVVNNIQATLSGNTFTASVPLTQGSNTLLVAAVDAAGNRTEVTRAVFSDVFPPDVTIEQPAADSVISMPQFEVSGTVEDDLPFTVTVNGVSATVAAGRFTATIPLIKGANTITVRAVDAVGNQREETRSIEHYTDVTPPQVTVTEPAPGAITNHPVLMGSVVDESPTYIEINGAGRVEVAPDGSFREDQFLPLQEGTNTLKVVAVDEARNRSAEVIRTFVVDVTSPVISELTPADESLINTSTTAISGHIADANAVTVTINNLTTTAGPNGAFTIEGVPIVEGENEIVITATDAAGNVGKAKLQLVGKDRTPPAAPILFGVGSPTRLAFQSIEGRAENGAVITISSTTSPTVTTSATLETGFFIASVTLEPGPNLFSITATDVDGNNSPATQVTITSDPNLSPAPGQPAQINISSGDAQRGLAGAELPRPVIAIVTDSEGHPVENLTVRFAVLEGGGQFVLGSDTIEAATDSHGRAAARYVSGSEPGLQLIRADFAGNISSSPKFIANTVDPSDDGVTSVSGVVEDQNLRALPNVLVRISGQQARTGADGRFKIVNALAGPHQVVEIIGRDQIALPGRWPNISYDIDVLSGVDNNLGRPMFLPRVNGGVAMPLDANNVVTQDISFSLPVVGGEPPARVTARAGTHVSFPPDVTDKRLSITRIPNNRVPMTLEDGLATNLYISVQPSGAIFEPALEVSLPNVDNSPAGSQVLLMSFDHEAGRYVQVGTATVSADGKQITSDPGSGIRVGAWHATPPPPPKPETVVTAISDVPCTCDCFAGPSTARPTGKNAEGNMTYMATVPSSTGVVAVEAQCKDCAQVKTIEFEEIDGKLFDNPDPMGGGRAIFPDADTVAGAIKRTVRVKIALTKAEKDIDVFVRSFDVDDSSGIFAANNDGNDNQGPTSGRTGDTTPMDGNFQGTTSSSTKLTTGPDGTASVVFNVTMAPGDNFKIAAGVKEDVVKALTVNKRKIKDTKNKKDLNEKAAADQTKGEETLATELLTVWRRLHMEIDSMPAPPTGDGDAERNFLKGDVTKIDGNKLFVTANGTGVTTPATSLDDNSPNKSGSGVKKDNGRFEKGAIEVGTGAGLATKTGIDGNGTDFVETGGIHLSFSLVDKNGANGVTGTDIEKSDPTLKSFKLNKKVTANIDYKDGKLTVAGVEFTVVSTNGKEVIVDRDPKLPFLLKDDDEATTPFLSDPGAAQAGTPFELMQTSTDEAKNLFAKGYIEPVYDLAAGTKTPAFNRNVEAPATGGLGEVVPQLAKGREVVSTDNFWTVYYQGAFQAEAYTPGTTAGFYLADGDPNKELNVSQGIGVPRTYGVLIFAEGIRDAAKAQSYDGVAFQKKTMPHETGHVFGLFHPVDNTPPTPTSIMTQGQYAPVHFSDEELKKIRVVRRPVLN